MSRSDYDEPDMIDAWGFVRWRGAVTSAMRGKRGQAALHEIAEALDAMQVKELIAAELVSADGRCCALGALGLARGIDMSGIDPHDGGRMADAFGLAEAMIREIEFENDYEFWYGKETPAQRWTRIRAWIASLIFGETKP